MQSGAIRVVILAIVLVIGIVVGFSLSYGIARSSKVDNACVALLLQTRQRAVSSSASAGTTVLSEGDWFRQIYATQRAEAHQDIQALYSCMAHASGAPSADDVDELLLVKAPIASVVSQFGEPAPSWKVSVLNLYVSL